MASLLCQADCINTHTHHYWLYPQQTSHINRLKIQCYKAAGLHRTQRQGAQDRENWQDLGHALCPTLEEVK